ncbi:MAG: molybdate ABC transporter substrate-binding protein [Hyphomicrobiaceae bacterium]|nr:molybdate ABC transporter substrate-binding protein [Hyphomicrobiaceae bacterium]
MGTFCFLHGRYDAHSHRHRPSAGLIGCLALASLCLTVARPAFAEEVHAAVATNFAEPIAALAQAFQRETGHKIIISTGATGALFAQIEAGAPFDIFLAADTQRPQLLENSKRAVTGTRFTYATGKLALWSADPKRIGKEGSLALTAPDVRAIAIADPAIAPYGAAAQQTLQKLGLWQSLEKHIVFGKNIGQTHALIATGNAQLGFVALSSVKSGRVAGQGSLWIVPEELYQPIQQDAVLLQTRAARDAAKAFLAYLKSDAAKAIVTSFGYGVMP